MNDTELKLTALNKTGFQVEALKFSIPPPCSSSAQSSRRCEISAGL